MTSVQITDDWGTPHQVRYAVRTKMGSSPAWLKMTSSSPADGYTLVVMEASATLFHSNDVAIEWAVFLEIDRGVDAEIVEYR